MVFYATRVVLGNFSGLRLVYDSSKQNGGFKMPLPETDIARVRRSIKTLNDAIPEDANDLVRYEIDVDARAITIVECRPPWSEDLAPEWTRSPIVRLRYTEARREWQIYWLDRNFKFHVYDLVPPTPNIDKLLAEIEADPTNIFWG